MRTATLLVACALGLGMTQVRADADLEFAGTPPGTQSGETFAGTCLNDSVPRWYAGPNMTEKQFLAADAAGIRAWVMGLACNRIVKDAWLFVPNGARYAHCGATAMPVLRRNVMLAYIRKHPAEARGFTQEAIALNALISAFNCKAGE